MTKYKVRELSTYDTHVFFDKKCTIYTLHKINKGATFEGHYKGKNVIKIDSYPYKNCYILQYINGELIVRTV